MAVDAGSAGGLTDAGEVVGYDEDDVSPVDAAGRRAPAPMLVALIAGLATVIALGGLSAWLGYRAHESQQAKSDRELYLQVARQGALNLTTVDHQHADVDIRRILDLATGQFHADFSQRSQPFVDVVKRTQSTSEGTVTEAGLESFSGDQAQALVAVSVTTSIAGAPEQEPRSWRMRLTVQRAGQDYKISNVGFVV